MIVNSNVNICKPSRYKSIEWCFEGINLSEDQLKNNFGFIYKIELSNGQFYIGRKQMSNFTLKQVTSYNSSNDFIKANKEMIINKEILVFTRNKLDTTYAELFYMINDNTWLKPECLNSNLLGKIFKSKIGIFK